MHVGSGNGLWAIGVGNSRVLGICKEGTILGEQFPWPCRLLTLWEEAPLEEGRSTSQAGSSCFGLRMVPLSKAPVVYTVPDTGDTTVSLSRRQTWH